MSPAVLALVIQGIQAAIQAAPQVVAIVEKGKELVTELFNGGLISQEQQVRIHSHIDAISAAALAGTVPPAWTVEADPVS